MIVSFRDIFRSDRHHYNTSKWFRVFTLRYDQILRFCFLDLCTETSEFSKKIIIATRYPVNIFKHGFSRSYHPRNHHRSSTSEIPAIDSCSNELTYSLDLCFVHIDDTRKTSKPLILHEPTESSLIEYLVNTGSPLTLSHQNGKKRHQISRKTRENICLNMYSL